MGTQAAKVDRPIQVTRAVALLWLALAIGTLGAIPAYVEPLPPDSEVPAWSLWLLLGFATGLWAILTYLISRRHNWARITTLIFTIFSVGGYVFAISDREFLFSQPPYSIAIEILTALMTLVALFWLFTGRGAAWFAR
jgi:hypothetical protein